MLDKLRLIIKVSRPAFWLAGPLLFLSGLYFAGGSLNIISIIQMICLSFPLAIFTFGINDIYDYESDRINPRKGSIQGAVLRPADHKLVMVASIAGAISLIITSVLTSSLQNIFCMSSLLLLLYLYSSRPIRLKERPPFDSLSNGLMVLLMFLLGYSFSRQIFSITLNSLLIALCVSGIHAYTTILDYKYDKKTDARTFAVAFGKRAAAIFPLLTFFLTLILARFSIAISGYIVFCMIFFFVSSVYPSVKLSKLFTNIMFAGFFISALAYIYMKIFK